MTLLAINLLGAPRVSHAGRLLEMSARKELALLAYLAVEPAHHHRRDHLLGLLWPDAPEEAARNNLRVVLARLRRTLGDAADAVLVVDRQQVRFLSEGEQRVDVLAFRELLAAVRVHSHTAVETCNACAARLSEATELYSGEFLHGFSLPDSAPFEEWATVQREHLHQQQLAALDTLASAAELRRDHAAQCTYARRQLALEPWREQAHAQLMRGLWVSGQRGAALEQYELCRRILADELELEPSPELVALAALLRAEPTQAKAASAPTIAAPQPRLDLSDIPEAARLYGREGELVRLERWLVDEGCRLVALLGIGGIGKTSLAAVAARTVAAHFDAVVWRSLLNAPPLHELLRDVLGRLEPGAPVILPGDPQAQIGLLLEALRRSRCLIVLDNLESMLRPDEPGMMREGYEGYAQLLRAVAERPHQSCLLLTSRERPQGMARWEADLERVRALRLEGLDRDASQAILQARGLRGHEADARVLADRYSGHPLALKLVAETVRELFGGAIDDFLREETLIFDDIRAILDQQFARLSALEQALLFWLAIEREPISTAALRANLVVKPPSGQLLEALRTLQRRSLLEQREAGFTLQNVVIEYLTTCLIDGVCAELSDGAALTSATPLLAVPLLNGFALLKTDAAEYVRQSQLRLLVEPVARQLAATHGIAGVGALVRRLLDALRDGGQRRPSYAAGNLLNLLTQLQIDLAGYDFSGLSVWQADLREVAALDVNFANTHFAHAAFSDIFDAVNGVALSPDGSLVAASSGNGVLGAWRVVDGQRHALFTGHSDSVRSVAFSPDGRTLASASTDATVRLWDVASGEPITVLRGHHEQVVAVAFVPATPLLVTGGADGSVRVWDTRAGVCRQVFDGHENGVRALAVDPAGALVAACDGAGRVHLWRIAAGEHLCTLAHPDQVYCVAFRADGGQLVTGCHDAVARVWDIATGEIIRSLNGHHEHIWSAVWSPDGRLIATGSHDTTIRLWDAGSGEPLRVLHGHIRSVNGLDWSHDGTLLVSAGQDETVRVWSAESGDELRALRGNAAGVLSVAFASGSATLCSTQGHVLRVWDVASGRLRRILRGHGNVLYSVSASRDGAYIASACHDGSVRVWDTVSGNMLHVLAGHTDAVHAVAWSPDGKLLASASDDRSVRLWDVRSGRLVRRFSEHAHCVRAVSFSPDGALLVSGDIEQIVRVWSVASGQTLRVLGDRGSNALIQLAASPDGTMVAHNITQAGIVVWDVQRDVVVRRLATSGLMVSCLAWSPDGTWLASGTADCGIRVWDTRSWEGHVLGYHSAWVSAVAWSPDGALLASSSTVGEIKLWDGRTGAPAGELRDEGPYAGMNITGATGLTDAQKAALQVLGAEANAEGQRGHNR